MGRTIFVTGTDTGVGKTVFTGLFLSYLRSKNEGVIAMKPFCSGSPADAQALWRLQDGNIPLELINPFYFPEPLAPLVAAGMHRRKIELSEVIKRIRVLQLQSEVLIIEGAGGLLVPLGESFTAADVIRELRSEVVVVARNRLGVLNHTLLTIQSLRAIKVKKIAVCLMAQKKTNLVAQTNRPILAKLVAPILVSEIKYLGLKPLSRSALQTSLKISRRTLAQLV